MDLVIITGTPGTGKTIIAKKISEISNSYVISLGEMVLAEKFITSYDNKRKTSVIDDNKIIKKVINVINNKKKDNYDIIIVESHFSDIVPDELIDHAIILRCHPEELIRRLNKRGYASSKVMENVQSEILGNCMSYLIEKQLKTPIIEIDTSSFIAEDVAKKIVDLIFNAEKLDEYPLPRIDWLEILFKENKLNDFFNITK
ncbi:MAG: adenylate kinase family protein [Promethearchaeota archaeon]